MSKRPEKSDIDAALAAPEKLIKSETEKKKYLDRKRREAARAAQERWTKSDDVPTVEDMLADLIKEAESPDNPYHEFRTLSRQRYAKYGDIPLEYFLAEFGQFTHALAVAGLRDRKGTRQKLAARAEASRREHATRYAERWIQPYVRENAVDERALHGTELVLSISDTHATFLDPFTWHCFLHACRDLEPDVVILNGDILEGSEISRHPKIPGWTVPLQLEFDFAREMFKQLREVCPDAEIIWTAGNHGLDRISMYMTQVAPAIAGLRALRFDVLAGVDEYGIQLAQGGQLLSPEGQEHDEPGITLHGFYRVYHGTRLGKTPALHELADANMSGQSGHVHRGQVIYGTNATTAGMSWMCTPMGCTPRAGRSYMKGTTTGWQKGWGIAFLSPDGRAHQYPVVTDGDVCYVEGYHYERPADLPLEGHEKELWLKGFKVPK